MEKSGHYRHTVCMTVKKGGILLCKHRWLIRCPAQPPIASPEKCKCLQVFCSLSCQCFENLRTPQLAYKCLCLGNEIPSWEDTGRELELCREKRAPNQWCACYSSRLWETITPLKVKKEIKRRISESTPCWLDYILIELSASYLKMWKMFLLQPIIVRSVSE